MKKVNFTLSVAGTLLLLAVFGKANAQTARLQLIHNAPAVTLDTVDVYLDNTKFDNIAFRTATQLLTVASGAHTVNVNNRNSADSGDMVLSRFPITLTASQNHIAILAGVDVPANYDANPNAVSTALSLAVRGSISLAPGSAAQTAVNFFQGTTDAPTWDIYVRPSTVLANDMKFGDISANFFSSSVASVIDVRDASGTTVVKSYSAPFDLYGKKSLVIFASGFRTPASNQNGAAFGVFAVDTNGGVMALPEVARAQFVNNSPDIIVDSVDIWLNNTRIADNLAFRAATPMMSLVPGTYDIVIAQKTSIDTSASTTLYRGIVSFTGSSTWVTWVKGVVNTAQYAPNPDGADISFGIAMTTVKEGAAAGQIEMNFYTGATDAPTMDFNEIGLPGLTKIANNLTYNSISPLASFAAGNILFNLTSADSSFFYGAYRLNTSGMAPKAGFIMTSGMFDSIGNPTQAKKMGLYAVFNDGTIIPLTQLSGDFQMVHNSADITADTVDVYVNGVKKLTKFAFRTATPFMSLNARVPYSIAIAPKGSASVAAAFYTTTLVLDSNTSHYVIVNGVKNTAQYIANPNGRNIAFKIFTYSGARKLATNSKNTDLLYFHGSTDLQATTIEGVGQIQFLSKNDAYGDFHGYAIHSAQDNIRYDIMDAAQDTVIKTVFGNIASRQSQAGLVFASGFLRTSASINQNGDSLILFVAWPDGKVDSIAPPAVPVTGLKEVISGAALAVYPNPAKDLLNVTLELNAKSSIYSEVIDITGKTVLTAENSGVKGKNTLTVSTSSLNSGIYFLSIKAGDQVITRKISISK